MTLDIALTLAILFASIALFVSERLRLDVVALLTLLSLVLTGVLPFEEAVAGFSSPLVLMIVGLFVVGAGLTETGVADWLGSKLARLAGEGEARLIVVVMATTALLSAFMSSTGTVAILLPVVGTVAQRQGIPLSRVLMPLAFAAHLGSLLTLIATPPNLVVAETLAAAGHAPFRFFSFTPIGLVILALGVAYFYFFGRRHLPRSEGAAAPRAPLSPQDLARDYGLVDNLHSLPVHRAPPVGPPSIATSEAPLVRAPAAEAVPAAVEAWALAPIDRGILQLAPNESLVEVVLPRRSTLVGKTLRDARFRDRYRATALGIRRGAKGEPVHALQDEPLHVGDLLLLQGRRKHLRNLRDERRDLILLAAADPSVEPSLLRRPALQALAITAAMLVTMAFGLLPNALAVLSAAVALVLVKSVRPADAYLAVNWESVVLIAGMLPMATALDRSGATALLVGGMEGALGGSSPHVVLAILVTGTSVLGLVLSNTATAVLVAPLALQVAAAMGLSPEPLLAGVAVAASASFVTPIASPVNTLVVGPGGYRFVDFVKVGLPLHVLVLLAALVLVPWLFPF